MLQVAGIFRDIPQWLCWVSLFLFHGSLGNFTPFPWLFTAIFPDFRKYDYQPPNGIDPSLEEAGIAFETPRSGSDLRGNSTSTGNSLNALAGGLGSFILLELTEC